MPVAVKASGSGYVVYEKGSGKIKSHHTTRAKAQRSANARNAARHGWKPTGKKARDLR